MGPQGAPGVIWRSPQPSKNESKTHQKITPTCPFAFLEHENCRFHRMQKLYKNQTFRNRIFYDSRSANGAPKVDLEAPKWAENSTKTHRADSAPTSKLRKDGQGARSRHSGRVGKWWYARWKAEIALDNIPRTLKRTIKATRCKIWKWMSCGDGSSNRTPT